MKRLFTSPARALRSALSLTLLAVALSACSTPAPVILTANDCASLIPDDWALSGIPSAPLPADKSAGAWVAFGVDQTGQLVLANARTKDAVTIVKNCEARDRKVAEDLKPKPWWHLGLW